MDNATALVKTIGDGAATPEARAKSVEELLGGLDVLVATSFYQQWLEQSIPLFIKTLEEGEPVFITEFPLQQMRKGILELLHRIPCNDQLRPHAKALLSTVFKLVEVDNEENVLICLRIVIELHKQYRPPFTPEVQQFLAFVRSTYTELPDNMEKIFDPNLKGPIVVNGDIATFNVQQSLEERFHSTTIQADKRIVEGNPVFTYTLTPKAKKSLKVLQELPIIVVLMYQIYKGSVQSEVAEFIPVVMSTISLQPNPALKSNPNFNKEVLVEFMGAQIKTLSFLAYIIKVYQDLVVQHSHLLVSGMISLLANCPMEVASLRRELFIATRHIMGTDLRFKFVPHMERLFDEDVLLGKGWTVNETMRPLAYSTLADLVHHVRQHLSLADLNRAVLFFSCHVHDESLPLSIQTMSCKLLFNLVESIRQKSEAEPGANGREIFMRMLDVLVYKFQVVAEVYIPYFQDKYSTPINGFKDENAGSPGQIGQKRVSTDDSSATDDIFGKPLSGEQRDDVKRFGFPISSSQNYSLSECRGLVKTVVCAVKTLSWGIASCKGSGNEQAQTANPYKQFTSKETEVYLRLIKWGMKAIDIYAVNGPVVTPNGTTTILAQRPINTQGVRSKEEKEVLEHFAGAFTLLNTYTFREIFAVSIDLLVQRIYENNALQVVANNLLANPTTSAIFATILVEYLLNKMPEMGDDIEKSSLYLRLFKLVFGSVSLFPNENEQMLRPHLRDIVNKAMELALNAKDPYNYFLLLRALFRSIGGGSHDLLYQEFLPLLPNLLQGLNSLQSGLHKHQMKDLFVELCLTVPVRLSSLLPYLPMLMDPLVSALNGSPTLISQGLRTLELCVDNLQPEFLYEHIQPVRVDLMQALWRTLRNSNDQTAVTAFRILGKFGGSNRKMMVEPQKLEYSDGHNVGQLLTLNFTDHKIPVYLPLEKVVEVAIQTLRSSTLASTTEAYYKKQAWQFVKMFVINSFEFETDRMVGNKVLMHSKLVDAEGVRPVPLHKGDPKYRSVLTNAIVGWFLATDVKELRRSVYSFFVPLLRHFGFLMAVQQVGSFAGKACNMDPYVIFDAIASVLANEEKDMRRPVLFALSVIMNCIINVVRSKDLACSLPMVNYMTEKFIDLCYQRAWYAKMGGCQVINFFLENMSLRWTLCNEATILRAMFFVLTDLTNEVSAGTVDLAKENLAKMIRLCAACSDENLLNMKQYCMNDMTKEFTRQLTSAITNVRVQSMKSLELLAEIQGKTVSAVIEPHKEVLNEMVLPKKHVIRHQSVQSQIGILDGITFCLSLEPKIFPLDIGAQETKVFVNEVLALSDAEEPTLQKLACYKLVPNLFPVRISLLNVLACVGHLINMKEKVVNVFFRAIASTNPEFQKCGYECLKRFSQEHPVEPEIQQTAVRAALTSLANIRTVTQPLLTQLSYLYQLFPAAVTDRVWEQLLQLLKKCLEFALVTHQKAPARSGMHELKIAMAILEMFHLLNVGPTASKLMEIVTKFCIQAEKALMLGKGSPLRKPLMKFLIKQPKEFIDIAFSAPYIQSPEWMRFFIYFLQQRESERLREYLMNNPAKLIFFLNIRKNPVIPAPPPPPSQQQAAQATPHPTTLTLSAQEQTEIQYFSVRIMSVLSDYDEDWILGNTSNRGEVVQALRKLWESPEYQTQCNSASAIFHVPSIPSAETTAAAAGPATPGATPPTPPTPQSQTPATLISLSKLQVQTWKEPQMIAKLLLSYYRKNNGDYDMLFKLLLAFCGKTIAQYHFLKEFLDKTVTKYSVQWKRQAFYAFVKAFQSSECSDELKAKIIQYVLIPCFAYCFDKGQADELIGSMPEPDMNNPNNLVNVFIMTVIDPDAQNISDSVRILLYQFSCLLVDQVPNHIHEVANKKQGTKLKRLMTFTWPCLLSKTCVDSNTKYYGHLLLCHIITKFALHKRIVLQTFHSLLKASLMEAKQVVKQALDIITPAIPLKMDDGYTMLIHWTKKMLVEEGHSLGQLMHLLQLVVRHWKVYYPVRHGVVNHMINGISRLGFSPTSTFDHRKLAVEMAEVIIKWELERIKHDSGEGDDDESRSPEEKRLKVASPTHAKYTLPVSEINRPLDLAHIDAVLSFLLRIACQVNEANPTPGSQGEILSKRCVGLIKMLLKPEVWTQSELKIQWFDKLFATLDSPQVNFPNICTALELLTYIIGILGKQSILDHIKGLQKGISACMASQNAKVVKQVHHLIAKLTSIFPTEFPGGSGPSAVPKCEELEPLYSSLSKVIYEGLSTYDKMTNANPQSLMGPLMMLKAVCSNSPGYIDRIITAFMKCLQKLAREHLQPAVNDAHVATELLILSLDLVKNRVGVMGGEMRKAFIGQVLVSLIEKSTDTKVMQAIVKILEEWIKNRAPHAVNQGPTIREKSILLVKLMQNVEKRFPGDLELISMFLELINFIYRDESLKSTELNSKLEPAFLSGLRCSQPHIREKFVEVFDSSIRRKLHERLMYVVCSQNWEAMGPHYWIKQCEELLLVTACDIAVEICPKTSIIPSETYGLSLLGSSEQEIFIQSEVGVGIDTEHDMALVQQLERDIEAVSKFADDNDEAKVSELVTKLEDAFMKEGWLEPSHVDRNMKLILRREHEFVQYTKQGFTTSCLTKPLIQLCHLDSILAEKVWISFFPRAWRIFTEKQQLALANEMVPFLCSGVHMIQQNCFPSALNTFVEALCVCTPAVPIKPVVLYYLGKNHNLWQRASLLLEQLALDSTQSNQLKPKKDTAVDCYEFEPTPSTSTSTTTVNNTQQHEVLDSLAELYCSLKEDDLWAGLWMKRAKFPETNNAITFELQSYYEKAQGWYEILMSKAKVEPHGSLGFSELKLWEEHWLKCAKELNQWDIVMEYSSSKSGADPFGVLEASWRNSNWSTVKDALAQMELGCPKEKAWKVHLYRGYVSVCSSEDQNLQLVERFVETAQSLCIKEWRRLPYHVAPVHVPLLQAAQQIVELNEAAHIHQALMHTRQQNTMTETKSVVKTWRNRLPCISDDLSHWSDIFTWRQLHYQFVSQHYVEGSTDQGNQTMLGVHASAQVQIHNFAVHQTCQAICHFGKISRKHNQSSVCLDALSKIYTIPSVPIVDCFQKIKQQVKYYIQQAQILGRNELTEALEIVESTNLKYFSKEMTSEFFALKGSLLAQIGRSDEAYKAFSAACQLHDTNTKAWGLWGDYLENQFIRDPRNMQVGIAAVTAFMHACRHNQETKARKYIAKILWLLMYDDEKLSLADAVEKFSVTVPPVQWLPWVQQLLNSLVRQDGKMVITLLSQVGRMYPQALYLPIRTLYLALKLEQKDRAYRHQEVMNRAAAQQQQRRDASGGEGSPAGQDVQPAASPAASTSAQTDAQAPIKASQGMLRCSKLMHAQRDLHPTILACLEGMVDQMIWFRENWCEEVLRQLKLGLAKCYAIAFENRSNLLETVITTQLQNFVKKLVLMFGLGSPLGVVQPPGSGGINVSSTGGRTTANTGASRPTDPSLEHMKNMFTVDFDSSSPETMKLHHLISTLMKWIKILEAKCKLFPKSILMEDRYRYLLNFNCQIAEVELPGEFLIPKQAHYYVKIARFQPRVEVVQKHNLCVRRIYIRGHNGKIYPYLIANDCSLTDARREERVVQMIRMLNHCLGRQKVTARRNLRFTVPKVVPCSPQMRLVEDNPASLSLLDIFKETCIKRQTEFDIGIQRYYEKIGNVQMSGSIVRGGQMSPQILKDIFQEIQTNLVPKKLLKEWAMSIFPNPSDYWTFRKVFTLQLCLAGFAEYAFHLTKLNPEMLFIHKDSGMANVSYFRFDLDETTCDLIGSRPVPFRLTPNIVEFITPFGVNGPVIQGIISLSRCLVYPNYKLPSILRAILRDEVALWIKKRHDDREILAGRMGIEVPPLEGDNEAIISMVTTASNLIMSRIQSLCNFEGSENKVSNLVQSSTCPDNLSKMDPTWYPWL